MNILEAIKDKLVTAGIGTFGTNLFIGELPSDKKNAILIVTAPSSPPNPSIGVFEQQVDFWTRYSNSQQGYAKLKQIEALLHRAANYEMGDYHVYISNSMSSVDDMDRDSERRKMWKLTIRFIYRED